MSWNISVSKPDGLVAVKTSGFLTSEKTIQMTRETFSAAASNGIRNILGDHSDLATEISILDIYNLPRTLLREVVELPIKVAVVHSQDPAEKDKLAFFETTALNTGMQVKLFTNLEDARLWFK